MTVARPTPASAPRVRQPAARRPAAGATAPVADHAPRLERAFAEPPREGAYRIAGVEGEVPAFVRGSYYLNGPARFVRGGIRYRHWLDGDGMVCALHFGADGVRFVNRYVRSDKLVEEEAAGRALYRTFGTAFDGDRLLRGIALASPVNVSVYPFAGTLLAFGEQGLPWELDPETLETRGLHTFNRRLNEVSPFSAHPHFDPESGEMFGFGVSFSARRPTLNLYRFTAGGELASRRRVPLDAPRSVHDFGLASRHAVFYLSPHLLDMAALAGGETLLDALRWRPGVGSRLLVVDRESGEEVASLSIGSRYCLHLVGCFERDGFLMVDVVELERPVYDQYTVPQLFPEVRWAQPVRYRVDLERGVVAAKETLDYRALCDFPAIDPRLQGRDYRDFWLLGISASDQPGRKFFDQLVHCDWRRGGVAGRYQAPPGRYLGGEPVFVPDPSAERRGAVICQEFDADSGRSAFLLFDAFDPGRGPIARLPLRSPVHLGFHACFHPEGS